MKLQCKRYGNFQFSLESICKTDKFVTTLISINILFIIFLKTWTHPTIFYKLSLYFVFIKPLPTVWTHANPSLAEIKQKCINTLMFHIIMSKKPFMIQLSKHQFKTHIKHDTQWRPFLHERISILKVIQHSLNDPSLSQWTRTSQWQRTGRQLKSPKRR